MIFLDVHGLSILNFCVDNLNVDIIPKFLNNMLRVSISI